MSRFVLARRGIAPAASEAARLAGHELVFDQRGLPLVEPAFAGIRPAPEGEVWGVLHEVTEKDFERLARYETAAYLPFEVEVEGVRAGTVTAWAYRTRKPAAERLPSARYLALLCAGAREHELPEEYVAALEARRTAYVPVLSELTAWSVRGFEWLFELGPQPHRERRKP